MLLLEEPCKVISAGGNCSPSTPTLLDDNAAYQYSALLFNAGLQIIATKSLHGSRQRRWQPTARNFSLIPSPTVAETLSRHSKAEVGDIICIATNALSVKVIVDSFFYPVPQDSFFYYHSFVLCV